MSDFLRETKRSMGIYFVHPAEQPEGVLCRSYLCMNSCWTQVQMHSNAGVRTERVRWALGVLADGLPEYLGSWVALGADGWPLIAAELSSRGVERIGLVLGAEAEASSALSACGIVCPGGCGDEAALASLVAARGAYVDRAREVSALLGERLKRAAARHGAFRDVADVQAFLARSAERFIAAEWPEPAGPSVRLPRIAVAA